MINKKDFQSGQFRRAFFVFFLGMTFLAPVLAAKERRGSHISIMRKDRTTLEGELVSVRGLDLIIADYSSTGVTVNLADAASLHVSRRPGSLGLAAAGIFAGGAAGGGIGYATADHSGFMHGISESAGTGFGALIGATVGGLIGGFGTARRAMDITIRTSAPAALDSIAKSLKVYARVRS
jgi:hypothetical protein